MILPGGMSEPNLTRHHPAHPWCALHLCRQMCSIPLTLVRLRLAPAWGIFRVDLPQSRTPNVSPDSVQAYLQ